MSETLTGALVGGVVTFVASIYKEHSASVRRKTALDLGKKFIEFETKSFEFREKHGSLDEKAKQEYMSDLDAIRLSVRAKFLSEGKISLESRRIPTWLLVARFAFAALITLFLLSLLGWIEGGHPPGQADLRYIDLGGAAVFAIIWTLVEVITMRHHQQ